MQKVHYRELGIHRSYGSVMKPLRVTSVRHGQILHPCSNPYEDAQSYGENHTTTEVTQRAELHKTIWRIGNDLRGSVDGWDFKQYDLGMLYYLFISENLAAYLND